MVDSQNLRLNPSQTAYSFPPHRRRPLRSHTYDALIQILAHCHRGSPSLKLPESVAKEHGTITSNSVDALVRFSNSKGSDDTIIQEYTEDENKEISGFGDGGFDGKQATSPELHPINSVSDGEREVNPSNIISIEDFLVVENETGDCAIQNAKEQENVNGVLDIQVDDYEVDNEFCIDQFNEDLDACFGMDMNVESSKEEHGDQDKGSAFESIPKDAEHELQLKEKELENLLHNSSDVEPCPRLNADKEIEEGEISGEAGVSVDAFSDDAASHGERITERTHTSEDYLDNGELLRKDEDRKVPQHETFGPLLRNIVITGNNSMKMETRKFAGLCHSQDALHDNHMETQRNGATTPCLPNVTPSSRNFQENAADQISSINGKDDDASKKKRKRGPLTKEKRAKKKKKERLKRAEKNRKLGVKRLKLHPVLKPKKIVYCRHFLQGRCHEGEKCNFSHDTVPLTKSKPCNHFARHSCMKGDECPFDHQLSKYPCNNYTSTGFCNRGSECLFSHEMPAKSCSITPNVSKPDSMSVQHTVSARGGSSPISTVTNPELKFLSPLNNSNSSRHMDNSGLLHQKIDTKTCSADQRAELPSAKPASRTGRQPPRGVSFFFNGANKGEQDGSSTKTPDGVGVGCKSILKVWSGITETNKVSEVAAPSKPRGINFLSFGQTSEDDSSNKVFSNLLSNSNIGTSKSGINDRVEGGILKVNGQVNTSPTILVSEPNAKATGTPLTIPQNLNFSSFNRTRLNDLSSNEMANLRFSKGDTALSFVKEKPSTSKLQDTVRMTSLSFGGLSDQPTGGQNGNFPSSLKRPLLSNTPSSVQKAVQSTLAFAEKLEADIKVGLPLHKRES